MPVFKAGVKSTCVNSPFSWICLGHRLGHLLKRSILHRTAVIGATISHKGVAVDGRLEGKDVGGAVEVHVRVTSDHPLCAAQ